MREIKFRCWDKKAKKMRQVIEIVFNTGFYMENDDNSVKLIWVKGKNIIENKEIQIQKESDFILMQYTGLKDKNGKEIYEGDIVNVTYKNIEDIGKIIYEHNGFSIDVTNMNKSYGRVEFIERYVEVIGNIYDNPELLEKG